jgi:hypothetical protein
MVPDLHGADKPIPGAIGGLALSVAAVSRTNTGTRNLGLSDNCQVERALNLVSSGTLTVAMAHGSKGKAVSLPRTLNPSTGKESMRQTGFSDAAWGKVTRGYAHSISALSKAKYDAIVKAAQPFTKPTRSHNRGGPTEVIDVDVDNERACLVDNSDSDSCNVFNFLFTDLTNIIFQDMYYCLPSSWTHLVCSIHRPSFESSTSAAVTVTVTFICHSAHSDPSSLPDSTPAPFSISSLVLHPPVTLAMVTT